MSPTLPEFEIVDWSRQSLRYLEHGWPDPLCRWHAHAEYELHLIVTSSGTAFVGDYVGDFGPGSLFLTGPNLPHNWVTDPAHGKSYNLRDMLVQFPQSSMDRLIKAFGDFREIQPLLDQAAAGVEFHGLSLEYTRTQMLRIRESNGGAQVAAFIDFLVALSRHQNRAALSLIRLKQSSNSKRQSQIGEAVDYIVEHYTEELSISRVAQISGMSEASFTRYFKQVTGNRFSEFVNLVRVRQACSLLIETTEPVSSICFDSGFQNLANFNRQFLRLKGCTPSNYRSKAIAQWRQAVQQPIKFR